MMIKYIFAIALAILPIKAIAEMTVRDSEMENIIIEATNPIAKVSGVRGKINLIFIQNPQVNAFTPGGNEIFIYTGLVSRFHDVDMIKGVIAHELGHIAGQHNARMEADILSQQKLALGGIAIGLAGAIASGNPGAVIAGAAGGSDAANLNLLKYSRAFEYSADQAAFQSLEKSGNSAIGMKELFDFFTKEQRGGHPDPYSLTHPLSTDRLNALNNFIKHSKYPHSTSSKSLEARYKRMSYKIFAFTEDTDYALQTAEKLYDKKIALYMKAVIYMRIGKSKQAIDAIDQLLASEPNDPYYNELKGQILLESGNTESLKYFEKASALLPNDALMKMNVAVVAFDVFRKDPSKLGPVGLRRFIPNLKFMQTQEPHNPSPYYYLSLYYEAMGQEGLRQVYLAIYYDKQGDNRGKILAKSALRILKKDTPEWYWAKDIADREQ